MSSGRRRPTVSVVGVTTARGADPWAIPPLFAQLVDDTSLLRPRASAPDVAVIVARYLAARDGRYGGLIGQLVCPVSRLPALVAELARAVPNRPVDLSLVVDTGLGAVPKALSTAFSRASLLTPRAVETAAPPDVDAMWLERVSEFVPEDVVAVVEPRRPHVEDATSTSAWLAAVRRVAEHGCAPKLRCGGPRASDVPESRHVEEFVQVVAETGRPFTVLGLREVVHSRDGRHGILNLLLAVARAVAGEDMVSALEATEATSVATAISALSEPAVKGVRGLVSHLGVDLDPLPTAQLRALGLLA